MGMPLPSSQFITMEYSSGPIEEMENRLFSASSLFGDEMSLPIRRGNRSGPLRTVRRKVALYRFTGSMSEHGVSFQGVLGMMGIGKVNFDGCVICCIITTQNMATWVVKPSLGSSTAPTPSPLYQACDQICIEPLTATPIDSPCGCVFPMKVRLLLDVATSSVFPVMRELEIEITEAPIWSKAKLKLWESTVVDINLVPLGEKFDNTTAVLTSDRFWHKKVPLNTTLFGNYEVLYISYPGSVGDLPITTNFINKNQRMNLKTITIISFRGRLEDHQMPLVQHIHPLQTKDL
ncbi:receptor-like serine/threonine-protein kinase ale2, partial [Quercus suber]